MKHNEFERDSFEMPEDLGPYCERIDGKRESASDNLKAPLTGAVVGASALGGATTLMSMDIPDDKDPITDEKTTPETHRDTPTHPELVDNMVMIATGVSDDMSFSEAFAAARAEVGPGGAFEWHGTIYGTYYADEWNNMSAEEKEAFNDHFAWNHHNGHIPDDNNKSVDDMVSEVVNAIKDGTADDIVVNYDADRDLTLATMNVGDDQVTLVDYDNDSTYEFMMEDADNSGRIEDNEITDIRDWDITDDDLSNLTTDDYESPDDGGDISYDYNDGI